MVQENNFQVSAAASIGRNRHNIFKEMGNTSISDAHHKEPLLNAVLGLSSLGFVDWLILVIMMSLVLSLGYALHVFVLPLCRRDAEDITELR